MEKVLEAARVQLQAREANEVRRLDAEIILDGATAGPGAAAALLMLSAAPVALHASSHLRDTVDPW